MGEPTGGSDLAQSGMVWKKLHREPQVFLKVTFLWDRLPGHQVRTRGGQLPCLSFPPTFRLRTCNLLWWDTRTSLFNAIIPL